MTAFHVQPILIVLLRGWILLTKISQNREYWAKDFWNVLLKRVSDCRLIFWKSLRYYLKSTFSKGSPFYNTKDHLKMHLLGASHQAMCPRWDPLNKKGSPKLLFQVSKEFKFMHIKIKQPVVHKFDFRITLSSWTDDLFSHTLRRVKQLSKC